VLTGFKEFLRPWKHRLTREHDLYWLVRQIQRIREHRPVRTVLDIGASIGRMTTLFATTFSEATIYCFEPQQASFNQLAKVPFGFPGRISTWDIGLGTVNSTLPMRRYMRPESSSFLPIQPYMMHDNGEIGVEMVEVQRLDDWAEKRVTHIDFMKVDVEGTELEVFQGAERTLEQTETVYVEMCSMRRGWHNRDHIETFERLHAAGLTYVGYFGDQLFSRDPEILRLG